MTVLLIKPSTKFVYGKLPSAVQVPLGLAYIASVLEKAGYRVRVLDMEVEKVTKSEFADVIKRTKPEVVGVTCTTPTYLTAIEICEAIKEISPEIITIIGGVHATTMPEKALKPTSIDYVVMQEGEITIKDLLTTLEKGNDLSNVQGIAYKKNGRVVLNATRKLIENLDDIPFPAWHLFSLKYTYPDSLFKKVFPIITSRGCPGNCTFCNTKNNLGRKFRARSALNVVDELEYLVKKYDAKEIHIWDDNFTTKKKRVFEIRDLINSRKLKIKFAFPNGIRADFLNEELLECLKEMGTYSIAIGVESGNQSILDRAKKGIKLEKIEETFRLTRKLKIETWAFFIIGLPGETNETIMNSIEFAKKIDPDIAKFHILKPYPGTQVYKEIEQEGLLLSDDYYQFGIHTPPVHKLPGLAPEDMTRYQKQANRSFFLRPSKIIQQILRLKSINRLKLNLKTGLAFIKTMLAP